MAEGFKQDYNFLWRLLGRVHAARGAIQNLMGEEVRESALLHLLTKQHCKGYDLAYWF